MAFNKQKLVTFQARKARTKTLIQLGSLVKLSGLVEFCDIILGEDLQMDIISRDKSAILLGILVETADSLHTTPQNDFLKWQQLGINLLKQTAAKKSYL